MLSKFLLIKNNLIFQYFFLPYKYLCSCRFKLTINNIKSEHNVLGNIWKPMRIAITGKEHGPDISQFITILGPKECSERLKQFLHFNGQ